MEGGGRVCVDPFKREQNSFDFNIVSINNQLMIHKSYDIVHSSSWKSNLGIKGAKRADQKKNAQQYVFNTYGKKVSQDESDAICIGTHIIKKTESAF